MSKSDASHHPSESQQERHLGYFIFLMSMVFWLSPLAIDMYLPALPVMAGEFNVSIDALEGTVALYLLGFALGQLIIGTMADCFDRRRILLIGVFLFALASFALAMSTSYSEFMFWRACQAITGGVSVVFFGIVYHKFGVARSAEIISYAMAAVVIAPLVAPSIGGLLVTHLHWSWIFWIIGIFALICFVLQIMAPPRLLPKTTKKALNLKHVVIAYQQVIRHAPASLALLTGAVSFAGIFAFIAGSPFVYIQYFGVDPQTFGLLLALNSAAMVLVNLVNARGLNRFTLSQRIRFGGVAFGVVSCYLLLIGQFDLSLTHVIIGSVMYMGMLGLLTANCIAYALDCVPHHTGVISGLNGVLRFGLGAIASFIVSFFESQSSFLMLAVMALFGGVTAVLAIKMKQCD